MDLGRNDPCWCGSGRKYKKCHLSKDERDRVEAAYAAQVAAAARSRAGGGIVPGKAKGRRPQQPAAEPPVKR